MRGFIPFAIVITVLSAALAPQDGAESVTETEVANPLAGPLHPNVLQFFAKPKAEEPPLALPGRAPEDLIFKPTPVVIHL